MPQNTMEYAYDVCLSTVRTASAKIREAHSRADELCVRFANGERGSKFRRSSETPDGDAVKILHLLPDVISALHAWMVYDRLNPISPDRLTDDDGIDLPNPERSIDLVQRLLDVTLPVVKILETRLTGARAHNAMVAEARAAFEERQRGRREYAEQPVGVDPAAEGPQVTDEASLLAVVRSRRSR